ncbi:MAG: hypothetical protein HYY93_06215 [Planctomycetes bacterium]|nr:hypothetical protein [Planctomycetota bacterium]
MRPSQSKMSPGLRLTAATTICVLALASGPDVLWAQASPPQILTLQGKLTNAAGDAQNGATDFIVRLYERRLLEHCSSPTITRPPAPRIIL